MTEWVLRYIQGYVRICFRGLEKERFLNLCAANGLVLWKLSRDDGSYQAFLSVRDFRRLRPITRKTRTRVKIIKRYGLPFFFYRNRKRKAFFLGMVLFLMILYSLSGRIWNIHVEGNLTYSAQTILETLYNSGIHHGMAKNVISCDEIAAQLRKEFPQITWVSVKIEGTRLLLTVKEEHPSEKVAQQEAQSCDLRAGRNGMILSIITRSGTPLVTRGQQVKKGELLVTGSIELKNDAGEISGYDTVAADADIIMRTSRSYYDEFPLIYKKKVYTGKGKKRWFLELFSHRISLGRFTCGDTRYEIKSRSRAFYLTENLCLPIRVGVAEGRPYRLIRKTYTREEAEVVAQKHLYVFLKNLTQKGVEICRKDVKMNTSETTCVTRGRITVKERAVKRVPIQKREVTGERTTDS